MSLANLNHPFRGALVAVSMSLLGVGLVQCSASGGGSSVNSGGSGGSAASGGSGNSGGTGGFGATSSGGSSGNTGFDAGSTQDASPDAFFVNDPPPADCSDGGAHPVTPGGTPQCPDDKNYEGCPCPKAGDTAACWPGKRANRNHGACQDGQTTCELSGESALKWGPCVGYAGIDPSTGLPLGTSGKAACTCFSSGYWKLDNLSPCFYTTGTNQVAFAVSTELNGSTYQCPQGVTAQSPAPTAPFSPNTVTADCTGYFKLCFTLKAYATVNGTPQPGDCAMQQVCTEAYYGTANQAQKFPDLPGWITDSSELACAQQFVTNGGYAEMSVDGTSDECDKVGKVFQTINYCPFKCSDPANAKDPDCVNCTNGGGGAF